MRLTTTTHVSLDGVLQGMGSADEDPRGGFTRGGWALGSGDPAVGDLVAAEYDDAAAFLLGRRTYEIFAGYWGTFPDPASHPVAAALHDRPRYVASRTLTHPAWPGTTVLAGDLAEAWAGSGRRAPATCSCPGAVPWSAGCWRTAWSTA